METASIAELGGNFVVIDAARVYAGVGFASLLSPANESLFEEPERKNFNNVDPCVLECDLCGQVVELLLAPDKEGEFGILIEGPIRCHEVRRHLRRFLFVRGACDTDKVLFQYYNPRVLRAFLHGCTESQLLDFFGPISAFHCQADELGEVLSFTLRDGVLQVGKTAWQPFLSERFPARFQSLQELGLAKRSETEERRNMASGSEAPISGNSVEPARTPNVTAPFAPYAPPVPDDVSLPDFG